MVDKALNRLSLETCMGLLMILAVALLATVGVTKLREGSLGGKDTKAVSAGAAQSGEDAKAAADPSQTVIAVDAGHGGDDPGKVGINSALEKDVNLAIARKLKDYLTEKGIKVVMTRETQEGLYEAGAANKKQQDMKKRCELIDASGAAFTVSIHQNSYTSESVHGPQVFYYTHSTEGEAIASCIQESLNTVLEVDRAREMKANDTYYLLKKTKSPTVIVECGFLSNSEEASKLITEEYQSKVAQAVGEGVLKALEGKK